MTEKRVIPFGEKMSERNCRLIGYVGQIAVMSRLGAFYELQTLSPTTSEHTARLRNMCRQFNDGKFLDVEARLLDAYDTLALDACNKIGFMRTSTTGRRVLDGDAQAAMNYHAGQADFRLPYQYQKPLGDLINYVAERTAKDIQTMDSINHDDTDQDSHYIARANGEIAYEVKYLTTDTVV